MVCKFRRLRNAVSSNLTFTPTFVMDSSLSRSTSSVGKVWASLNSRIKLNTHTVDPFDSCRRAAQGCPPSWTTFHSQSIPSTMGASTPTAP